MAKWRLAQQKTQEAGAPKKGTSAPKRERRPGELSTFQKAVIIVFIAVFALSTLAGALASVVQSSQQTVEYNVDYVDSQYEGLVADLEKTLEGAPDDKDALLQVARYCSSWGQTVGLLAQTDEERVHGEELLQRAIGYYDRCLEVEATAEASAERALCVRHLGDTETAIADLEKVTQTWPDYAPAWADLGRLYELEDRGEEATAAYEQAIALDPDDEQGAKSFAEGRLESMKEGDSEDGVAADATANDESSEQGGEAPADQTNDSSASE